MGVGVAPTTSTDGVGVGVGRGGFAGAGCGEGVAVGVGGSWVVGWITSVSAVTDGMGIGVGSEAVGCPGTIVVMGGVGVRVGVGVRGRPSPSPSKVNVGVIVDTSSNGVVATTPSSSLAADVTAAVVGSRGGHVAACVAVIRVVSVVVVEVFSCFPTIASFAGAVMSPFSSVKRVVVVCNSRRRLTLDPPNAAGGLLASSRADWFASRKARAASSGRSRSGE